MSLPLAFPTALAPESDALLSQLAAPLAEAEPFRFEAGVLEIPAGFIGPTEQRRGSELALYGFAKPRPGRETSTLLQVIVLTLPSGAADLPQDEEARAAE